jgi:photosystem II stability/assembly factor-like uncharacterized protein
MNWSLLDGTGDTAVRSLAADLRRPGVLYAANLRYDEVGLIKSTDGGKTWFAPSPQFVGAQVEHVAVSPVDSRVYVGVSEDEGKAVYASTDEGKTFVLANGGLPADGVSSITPDSKLACIAYAATAHGVFRTLTAGGTCH